MQTGTDVYDQINVSSSTYALSGTYGFAVDWNTGIWSIKLAAASFSISGSAGVAGATVAYSGTASGSVTADGSGNYTIPGLANGPYTITPSLSSYSFSPSSANETVSGSNITGVNFTATFLQVSTPIFSPVAGAYNGIHTVVVSDIDSGLPGFAMYYTLDGSTPTTGSTLYTGLITVASSLTIKVLAVATSYANSSVASASYTITILPIPVLPSGGTSSIMLPLVAFSQNNRCTLLNVALDKLDTSWTENETFILLDADYSVRPNDITSNIFLRFEGTLTATRNINLSDTTLPGTAIGPRAIIVMNATTSSPATSLVFKGGTGTQTVTLSNDGFCHVLWYDGIGKVYQII